MAMAVQWASYTEIKKGTQDLQTSGLLYTGSIFFFVYFEYI